MTNYNTGGMAFPDSVNDGMTLLDYFAGQVLSQKDDINMSEIKQLAQDCYEIAEAMVAEKHRREGKDEREG